MCYSELYSFVLFVVVSVVMSCHVGIGGGSEEAGKETAGRIEAQHFNSQSSYRALFKGSLFQARLNR